MITYIELEELKKSWKGKVCIFGAGELGKHIAYDMLSACGFSIDFYCDNYIPEGTLIRDGIAIRNNQYLYDNKDSVLVFVCLSVKFRETVLMQLKEHKIRHTVTIDMYWTVLIKQMIKLKKDIVQYMMIGHFCQINLSEW